MKKVTLVPMKGIDPEQEFWSGTKLRKLNVGMNVKDKSHDYFDHMIACANWDIGLMMIVNIT